MGQCELCGREEDTLTTCTMVGNLRSMVMRYESCDSVIQLLGCTLDDDNMQLVQGFKQKMLSILASGALILKVIEMFI